MRLKLLVAFAIGATAGAVAGCQTYDFQPVVPLAVSQTTEPHNVIAKQLKPNLMFLIDKSGSMNFPADATLAGCVAAACSSQAACCMGGILNPCTNYPG